jgi:E3 ubiquitin-protein ligase CHFR
VGGTGGCLQALRSYQFRDDEMLVVVNRNEHESQILRDYLTDKGISREAMWKTCMDKLESGAFKSLAYPPAEAGSPSCRMCARRVLGDLVYQFRTAIPTKDLPLSARMRPDGMPRTPCWYGRECRTQTKAHHAMNFDHICENLKKS